MLLIECFQSITFNGTLSMECFQSNGFNQTLSIKRFQLNASNIYWMPPLLANSSTVQVLFKGAIIYILRGAFFNYDGFI